jgi:glycosyltransferase involved in cell wall biosynthesis
MHDVAACLPPAWRDRAEIDCDDWEAATRLSLGAIAFRQGRYGLARRRLSEAVRYALIERKVLRTYRRVHVAAAEDATRLRRLTGIRQVEASPNRIVVETGFAPTPCTAGSRTLLFVGALFYPPNGDAMLWFGGAVLPHLRRLVPDVRVVAAGRAEEDLQRSLARDGIDYIHAPHDLRPIYAGAAAVIAPLRGGGGTKLKVLEAWLHERPLVATSHAARGLAAEAGRHLLVANRPRAFARACAAVLLDRELADRLVAAGRDLLQARYRIDGPDAVAGSKAPAGEG